MSWGFGTAAMARHTAVEWRLKGRLMITGTVKWFKGMSRSMLKS
jgi:hypothetical protein